MSPFGTEYHAQLEALLLQGLTAEEIVPILKLNYQAVVAYSRFLYRARGVWNGQVGFMAAEIKRLRAHVAALEDELRAAKGIAAVVRTRAMRGPANPHSPPTARELEIESLVMTGKSLIEIAAALKISDKTIEVHVGRLARKRGVRGVRELMALRIRELTEHAKQAAATHDAPAGLSGLVDDHFLNPIS